MAREAGAELTRMANSIRSLLYRREAVMTWGENSRPVNGRRGGLDLELGMWPRGWPDGRRPTHRADDGNNAWA